MASASLKAYRKQNTPVMLSPAEMKQIAFNEVMKQKEKIEHKAYMQGYAHCLLVACETLIDQSGYGKTRLQRFVDRLNFKTHCIGEGYVSVEDLMGELEAIGVNTKAEASLGLESNK